MTNYNYNYSDKHKALATTDDNFRRTLALDSLIDVSSVSDSVKSTICSAFRFPAALAEAFDLDIDNPSQVRRVCKADYSLCYWLMRHPASLRWYLYRSDGYFYESSADYSLWGDIGVIPSEYLSPYVSLSVSSGTACRCMTDLTNGIVIILYNTYTIQSENQGTPFAPCVVTGFSSLNGLLGGRLAIIRPNISYGSSGANYYARLVTNSGIILDSDGTKYTSLNIKCFWSEQRFSTNNTISTYDSYSAHYNTNSSTNLIVSPFCVETVGVYDKLSTNSIGFGVIPTSVVGRTPTVGLSLPVGYQFMQGQYVHLGDGYIVKWNKDNGLLW